MDDWRSQPHRRLNPLTGEWVLVSPHRDDRPWLGERVESLSEPSPRYDPHCYLCPGNPRVNGERNPPYESVYVFQNDFAALLPQTAASSEDGDEFAIARSERGICRVVCFSPRHDLHLASMSVEGIERVVACWADQYTELAAMPFVAAVTTFENRGAAMGASNPHPHGQIWANSSIPNELAKETAGLLRYDREHGRCLLCAYAAREIAAAERIVYANEHFVVVVPFWAIWPFETLILPHAHAGCLADLDATARTSLARAIGDLTARYDRLFGVPFPYSMGFHQRPCNGQAYLQWHLHAHYYPPLLRSASVRKYMVGYEMLAQPQRDLTPERAAEHLRGR